MPEKIWDFNIAPHSADNKHYACRETEAKGVTFLQESLLREMEEER